METMTWLPARISMRTEFGRLTTFSYREYNMLVRTLKLAERWRSPCRVVCGYCACRKFGLYKMHSSTTIPIALTVCNAAKIHRMKTNGPNSWGAVMPSLAASV